MCESEIICMNGRCSEFVRGFTRHNRVFRKHVLSKLAYIPCFVFQTMASAVLESINQSHMMSDSSASANADFLEDLFGQIDDATSSSAPSHRIPDDEILAFLQSEKPAVELVLPEPSATEAPAEGEETKQSLVPDENAEGEVPSEPASKTDDERPESAPEEAVFKRPVSPRIAANDADPIVPDASAGPSVPPPPTRVRRELRYGHRLEPHPAQKCFLTGIKRKRPPTESGELINLVKMLNDGGKLLFPDVLLADYLEEAGVERRDSKVARLMGAAAEHHSACIIQDAMQLFLDNHHDRRKHGKEKEHVVGGEAVKPEKPAAKAKPAKIGRPSSAVSKGSDKSKGSGKGHKRKGKNMDDNQHDSGMETDLERDTSLVIPTGNADVSFLDTSVTEHHEGDDEAIEKSTIKSVVSKDEREVGGPKTKKEKEKEAEKRHVLTLDVLAPVLRDHGYHAGRPPYLVN